jgi:hypothetical protein
VDIESYIAKKEPQRHRGTEKTKAEVEEVAVIVLLANLDSTGG